jgi:hypothetical protein
MASDSRLSLTTTKEIKNGDHHTTINHICVGQSDFSYKTFLAHTKCGISTFGAADVQGVPIAGFIESFIDTLPKDEHFNIRDVPPRIVEFFQKLPIPPDTGFHIAGYETVNGQLQQALWRVSVPKGEIIKNDGPPNGGQGVSWDGEPDVFGRLVKPVALQVAEGQFQPYPIHKIPYEFFTLQDAIDFCIYAIRTTIDTMRFQNRPKTVGNPIDVLVIKPNEAFWIQRKTLHGEQKNNGEPAR